MDWPLPLPLHVDPIFITTVEEWCKETGVAPAYTSAAPGANEAIFAAVRVRKPMLVKKLYVFNGDTASGNIDVGLYTAEPITHPLMTEIVWHLSPATRLVSAGSTAQSGTDVWQVFDVADTLIQAGIYFLAVALNNGTGELTQLGTTPVASSFVQYFGNIASAGSSFPLPASVLTDSADLSGVPVPVLAMGGIA